MSDLPLVTAPGFVSAITGFPLLADPYTNIQPFTYRDGLTYLEVQECLRDWLQNTLSPAIDANMTTLQGAWDTEVASIITAVNTAIDASNVDMANLVTEVNNLVGLLNADIAAAANSATAAANSATASATSATNAATSATAAGTSATNAANSATKAVAGATVVDAATYGGGVTDATTYLQGLFAAADAAGTDIVFPAGKYKLTGGLTWNPSRFSVRGQGAVYLDFSTMTTGVALTVNKDIAEGGGFEGTGEHTFSAIRLIGPDTDTATVDGIYGNGTNGTYMVTFRNVGVYGFRYGFKIGSNNWLFKFYDSVFAHSHTANIYINQGGTAGENYSFFGCVINNAHNAGGTAIGLNTVGGEPDLYFYGCSFDYNDIEIVHTAGKVSLSGGHIENGNSAFGPFNGGPMIKCKWVPGGNRTLLTMTGVSVTPTETKTQAMGRDHLIESTSDSGDHVYISCFGVLWDTYNNGTTIFKNMAPFTLPIFKNVGGNFDNGSVNGDRATVLAPANNLLYNGDFEQSSTAYLASGVAPFYPGRDWSHGSVAGLTFGFDTVNMHSGTRCASIVGAAGNVNTTSLQNAFTVKPGDQIIFSCWVNIAAYTSGTIQPRVSWYLGDFTTRTVVAFNPTPMAAATSGWVPVIGRLIVPPGITTAMFDVQAAAFVGTAYVDDVMINTNS